MRCLRVSSLILLGVLCTPAQDLKEFEKKITDFTLPNGLHFILLERHEAPVVALHTLVNAGSADDPPGQTGMARLMERVAYKGTEAIGTTSWTAEKKALDAGEEAYDRAEAEAGRGVKTDSARVEMLRSQARLATESAQRVGQPNEYQRILVENGAVNRVTNTGVDATTYAYSLPSNRIELWFLMESQRLLRPAFRDFYKERDAQAADYRQQVETNPQGKLFGEFLATAFQVHPYRNPTGGWPGDIENLRRTAARDYFDRYYAPGNITIAMVGDVNPADVKRMAEKYFGPMAAKAPALPPHAVEPPQEGPRMVVLESTGASVVAMGYKRPAQSDKDDVVFDVIQFLLSSGTTGLLYRDMVMEKHLSVQARVAATFPGGRFPSLLAFVVVPAQGRSLEENQRGLEDFLNRFKTLNIEPQSLARAKAQIRSSFYQRAATGEGMAALLAVHQAQFGDWRKMFASIDELNKVTVEAIQRVAAKALVATGRTTVFTVPPGTADVFNPAARPLPAERKTGGAQ